MRGTLLLAGLGAATAVGLALRVNRRRRRAPALPRAAPPPPVPPEPLPQPPAAPPRVTILLPVRDEEDNLLPCLDTLLAQTVRPEILVVDDGSTDATRGLAEERARTEGSAYLSENTDVSAETSPRGNVGGSPTTEGGMPRVSAETSLSADASERSSLAGRPTNISVTADVSAETSSHLESRGSSFVTARAPHDSAETSTAASADAGASASSFLEGRMPDVSAETFPAPDVAESSFVGGEIPDVSAETSPRPGGRAGWFAEGGGPGVAAETSRRASAAAAAEVTPRGRLQVIGAPPPPPGWGGKVHALETGYRHLLERSGGPPDWILSTDADTRHHPELLARALTAAEAFGLDAVSVAGHQEVAGVGENLLTPPVFALLDALLPDWPAAARGEGPAVANGQFILLREPALAAIGGFAAVAGAPIDDVALARALRETGHRTGFWRAPDLLRVRMYQGFGKTLAGWRRNLGGIFGPQPALTRRILAVLLAPPAALLLLLLAGRRREAALLWTGAAAASALLRAGAGHRPGWGLLYPLEALVLAAALGAGTADWRRGRLVRWRGREVPAPPG